VEKCRAFKPHDIIFLSELRVTVHTIPVGASDLWASSKVVRLCQGVSPSLIRTVIDVARAKGKPGWSTPRARSTSWSCSEGGTPLDLIREMRLNAYDIMRGHLENLGLTKVVTIVRDQSAKALVHVPTPIDFLFIDGDHSYDRVKADWHSFTPHMSPFGVVVFHDTIWDLRPDDKWYRSDMGFLDSWRSSEDKDIR